ncbi:DeoR family transcriptional regulator [Streptomyces sp. NP160]|uniref:DeoR family transcriptional regulator n=1 Tax=Streptomyces sp. NP160 TaxID=2586637 RepID=UPI0015D580A4|nr:DeoR family transcriptional regulator [Streptomyces sp. NP160]
MSGERWDEITRWVDTDGRVGLGDLASHFEVSEMTIRRDLDALTAAGRLRRVRGGAVSLASPEAAAPAQAPRPAARAPKPETEPPARATAAGAAGGGPDRSDGSHGEIGAGGSPEPEELPSPGFDLSRAPASLGSVIASWAGAFPAGFPAAHADPPAPQPTSAPAAPPPAPARPAPASHARAQQDDPAEAPPGWDLPPSPTSGRPGVSAQQAPVDDPWVRAAHAALGDLSPGTAVLLTGGTGALALAHHVVRLAGRSPATPVTVAVTALAPATVLAGAPGVRLVVLGGEAEPAGTDLVGPSALAALEDLHLDVAVLTPTGLDARGAWAPTSAAAALVAAAVARAERSVAVVAPGALGRPGLVRAAPLGALAQVVAVPAPGEDAAALAARLEAVRAAAPSAPRVSAA